MFDGKDAGEQITVIIADLINDVVARILPGALQRAIEVVIPDVVSKVVALVPTPRDGKDGSDGHDAVIDVDAIVAKVVPLIPAPKDGTPGKDGAPGTPGKDGAPGQNGADGASVDAAEIIAQLYEKMLRIVEALPKAQDGRDGKDGRDADPVDVDDVVAKVLPLIPVPKNGADGSSVTVDDLRPIVEAESARWQLEFERRAGDMLRDVIEKMPKPTDGKDGQDALQIEDFEAKLEGRIFTFALRCGERVVEKKIKVPFPVDRGVYRPGMACEQGDVVTFGGSQWIAVRDTTGKPPSDDWRCQVQRGRDGKDSK